VARTRPAISTNGGRIGEFAAGDHYREQYCEQYSIECGRHDPGILGWGDEAHSPAGEQLTHLGFLRLRRSAAWDGGADEVWPEFRKNAGGVQTHRGRRSWKTTLRF